MKSTDESPPSVLLVIGAFHPGVAVVGRILEKLEAGQATHLESLDETIRQLRGRSLRDSIDSEYAAFNEIELLPALSRRWVDLAPSDWQLLAPSKRQNLELIAGAVIKRGFLDGSKRLVITDSIYGCLLPFWIGAISSLGYSLKIACVVCPPQEVGASMSDSLGLSLVHSDLYYISYWLNILPKISSIPHCFTSYENLALNAETEIGRISRCLLLQSDPSSESSSLSFPMDKINQQQSAETNYACVDKQDALPCREFGHRIYLQLLKKCFMSSGSQELAPIDDDICKWYTQSHSLMRAYDQLNSKYQQCRDKAMLLRAANQGYAEYFSWKEQSISA